MFQGAKQRKEISPGANTFVTASVRQPIVSIDRNPPALGKHPQTAISSQNPGTLGHLSNTASFAFPTDSPTFFDTNASFNSVQLRKLSDLSVVSVPQVMSPAGKSIEMGTTGRSAFSPVMGTNLIGTQDATASKKSSSSVTGAPRLPPRVPLQQKPFGKQHKRNSANCSGEFFFQTAQKGPCVLKGARCLKVGLS